MIEEAWFEWLYKLAVHMQFGYFENLHVSHQIQLHYQKNGVWCAVNITWITSYSFITMLITAICEQHSGTILLRIKSRRKGLFMHIFQQDNVPTHTIQNSMQALQTVLNELILNSRWFLNLNVCKIYLWENLKQNIYRNNPHTLRGFTNQNP
jgi:hypothetical protein